MQHCRFIKGLVAMQKLKMCVFWGALPVRSLHTPITYIFDKDITQAERGGFQMIRFSRMDFLAFPHTRLAAASLHYT